MLTLYSVPSSEEQRQCFQTRFDTSQKCLNGFTTSEESVKMFFMLFGWTDLLISEETLAENVHFWFMWSLRLVNANKWLFWLRHYSQINSHFLTDLSLNRIMPQQPSVWGHGVIYYSKQAADCCFNKGSLVIWISFK